MNSSLPRAVMAAFGFIFTVQQASAQELGQYLIAKDICSANELSIDLGANFPKQGAIEILVPLPDTDGRDAKRYAPNDAICIPFPDIVKWEQTKSSIPPDLGDYDATFFVTYDPLGTLASTRSRFDYDVLMCEELPETPRPPKGLRFGTFNWTSKSGIKSQKVAWISDLRAKLESDCQ